MNHSTAMTRKQAESALTQLLYFCTDERLAGFTAESLAGSYNVPIARVSEMLDKARRARG